MTFTGSINAGSMLGSSSYGTLGGLYDEKGGGYFLEDITDITKKDDMTLCSRILKNCRQETKAERAR